MAEVTGPISTLPGSTHALPAGAPCDEHPDRPAVARVQGETDSMGSELNDLCQECLDQHHAHARSPEARTGKCDFCGDQADDLSTTRDYEEGLSGPVYRVCGCCMRARNKRIDEELAETGYYDGWDEIEADDDGLERELEEDGDIEDSIPLEEEPA